jgi:CHAT domain-containing protein
VKLLLSIWLTFLILLISSWGNTGNLAFAQNLNFEDSCLVRFPAENLAVIPETGEENLGFLSTCIETPTVSVETIDPHAAIIHPIILSDRIEVTVSIPQQPSHHYTTLIPQSEVEATINQMRQSMRQTSFAGERLEVAQRIYTWLLADAAPELDHSSITTLVFILDNSLCSLPMAALHNGQKYLIQKYQIVINPSKKISPSQPIQTVASSYSQAIIAGISKPNQEFDPLPGVEKEIIQISRKIPATVLLDENFTLENLRKQLENNAFSILHLATHAQFGSHIEDTFILAWNQKIHAQQLIHLLAEKHLHTSPIDLLVLSACQTAKGDSQTTLGLAGIANRSGVRSTLASLWTVNDISTARFMDEFYYQLLSKKNTKAAALRQAQLHLLQQTEFEHPYHWAPFIIVGNWL